MIGIQTNIRKFNINPKLIKRLLALVIVVALVVTGVVVYRGKNTSKQTVQAQQTTRVRRGDFNVSITGTGSVASASTATVAAKIGGTVTKIYHIEGDTVKAGDLLYEMDDSTQNLNIEKIKNNISTAQLTANNNLNDISKLNIRAPFSGIITSIPVKTGETAAKNAQVATIIDQSKLKLTVPIKVSAYTYIGIGTPAFVHVQTIMQSIGGVVTQVSSPILTSDGMQMLNLEVTIPNTGTLKEGLKATVELNTGTGSIFSTDTGTLSYINSSVIKSETGGSVDQINFREGSSVQAGDVIMTLSSSDLLLTKQSNDIKLKDLGSQLETETKQLEYYKVYASIDGNITKQSLYVDDAVRLAEDTTTISNIKLLQCTISIDELDIAKIKVGQKTNITAEALTDTLRKPLQGEVKSIGIAGTTTNGVTTYPVLISIPYTEGIRIGMNVNIEIFIQSKQNTMFVPIEAVQKIGGKNYVIAKGGTGNAMEELASLIQSQRQQGATGNGQSQQRSAGGNSNNGNNNNNNNNNRAVTNNNNNNNRQTAPSAPSGSSTSGARNMQSSSAAVTKNTEYYKNTTLKEVELGINNENSIEILSGVSEGDELVLPPKVSTQGSTNQNNAVRTGVGGMNIISSGQGGQQPPSQGVPGGTR